MVQGLEGTCSRLFTKEIMVLGFRERVLWPHSQLYPALDNVLLPVWADLGTCEEDGLP